MIEEIKRIIKQSEILKYEVGFVTFQKLDADTQSQGGRLKMATKKQGRSPRAGNPTGQRTHLF